MEINIHTILDLLMSIAVAGFGMLIFTHGDSSKSTKLFGLLLLSTSLWCLIVSINFPIYGATATTKLFQLIIVRFSYAIGTIISTIFLFFALIYTRHVLSNKLKLLIIAFNAFFIYSILFTDNIIEKLSIVPTITHFVWKYGQESYIFDLYFIICWTIGAAVILISFIREREQTRRAHLKSVFLALVIGVIPPAVASIYLPRIGIYDFDWIGPASGIYWIFIIAYSILRHRLFNVKLIAIEMVTVGLWILMLFRIMSATDRLSMIIDGAILFVMIFMGILLIRSIMTENTQRTRIQELAANLKVAYEQVDEAKASAKALKK